MKRKLTISGFDDVIDDIKKIHTVKLRRKEMQKTLHKTALPVKQKVKSKTPIFTGSKSRTHTTGYKRTGASMTLNLSAGTLKRSVAIFKAKKSKNPRVVIGHRVLKRPRNYKQWISNAKKWDKNGWYGIFLLYGTKQGIKANDYLNDTVQQNKTWIAYKMKMRLENYLNKKNL